MRTLSHWIGEHANKVRAAIWQLMLVGVAMKWITLDEAQLAVWGIALSAVLDLFVESNTVSKVRVGERITQEVNRQMGTGPQ